MYHGNKIMMKKYILTYLLQSLNHHLVTQQSLFLYLVVDCCLVSQQFLFPYLVVVMVELMLFEVVAKVFFQQYLCSSIWMETLQMVH